MAMQLDVNTVVAAKLIALVAASPRELVTQFRSYLDLTIIAADGNAARNDLTTRVWLNLPKT